MHVCPLSWMISGRMWAITGRPILSVNTYTTTVVDDMMTSKDSLLESLQHVYNCIGEAAGRNNNVHPSKEAAHCRQLPRRAWQPISTKADSGDKESLTEADGSLSECDQKIQNPSPQKQQQQLFQRKKYPELDDSCISIVTAPMKPVKIECNGQCPVKTKYHGGWCTDVVNSPPVYVAKSSGQLCQLCGAHRTPITIVWVGRWMKNTFKWLWGKKSHFAVATVSFLVGTFFKDYCQCLYTGGDVDCGY